jgi:hypothetical protein
MQIVHCKNCNESTIGFGTTSVNVTFKKHKQPCDKCNHTDTEEQNHFFCSDTCFFDYIKRISDGDYECNFNWKKWTVRNGNASYE